MCESDIFSFIISWCQFFVKICSRSQMYNMKAVLNNFGNFPAAQEVLFNKVEGLKCLYYLGIMWYFKVAFFRNTSGCSFLFLIQFDVNKLKSMTSMHYQAGFHLFKVNNGNIRTMCKICSTLAIMTPEQRHWRRFFAFIVNFVQFSYIFLLFSCKCRLGK